MSRVVTFLVGMRIPDTAAEWELLDKPGADKVAQGIAKQFELTMNWPGQDPDKFRAEMRKHLACVAGFGATDPQPLAVLERLIQQVAGARKAAAPNGLVSPDADEPLFAVLEGTLRGGFELAAVLPLHAAREYARDMGPNSYREITPICDPTALDDSYQTDPHGIGFVLSGNLSDGIKVFGPFSDGDEATQFAEDRANAEDDAVDWRAVTLEPDGYTHRVRSRI